MSYIGDKKIKKEFPDGEFVQVTFDDKSTAKIHGDLLTLIKTEEKRDGGVTDVVRLVLASKILTELADYGLEYYMVDHIAQGIQTYAHNLREVAIGEKFGCHSAIEIPLRSIIQS